MREAWPIRSIRIAFLIEWFDVPPADTLGGLRGTV